MDSPQGKNQELNGFVNNFAHDMINQKKITYDLLKSGRMSERDYTLATQNQMDGTKRLFDISKTLQESRQATLDGIASGDYQSGINLFNRGMVEQYNFNNSKAIIDPVTGNVSLGLLEDKVIDGKTVKVMSRNIAPVNVLMGKIAQTVPTFQTDKQTTEWVKNFADKKTAVYQHATTSGAGTITEYLGPEFLSKLTNPIDKQIASDFNKSIDDLVSSKIGDPYNMMSVLTENTGRYDNNSFTFDKDLASKDKSKILVMVDPASGQTNLDKTAPNYESQKKEASAYVKGQILLKLDAEKKITTTGQLEESSATKARNAYRYSKDGEAAPPAIQGEYLNLQTTDKKGNKSVIGVTQRIEGLVFPSGKGVELAIDQLSYNNNKGTLELSGRKISGKEESGKTTPGKDKTVGKEGETVVKEEPFVKNDIDSAPLLSTAILKFRNPLDPNGGNFTSVKQAKEVLKRVYQSRASNTPAKKTIQFDSQGNIIQQ